MSVTRDRYRFDRKEKWFAATTHVVNSTEPPGADPHARWCGRGAVARSPYPDLMISGNAIRKSLFVDLIKTDQLGLSIMIRAAPGIVTIDSS